MENNSGKVHVGKTDTETSNGTYKNATYNNKGHITFRIISAFVIPLTTIFV